MAIHPAKLFSPVIDLFLPEYCPGCSQTLSPGERYLCIQCLQDLPETNFHLYAENPVAKKLAGRILFESATACYFFHKSASIQSIIHHFKYRNKREVARFMGRQMG